MGQGNCPEEDIMTRFVDKTNRTVVITMIDNNTGIAFENDFFEIGTLEHDEDGAYIVDDIVYLIQYACSYAEGTNPDIDYERDDEGEIILPNIDVIIG